MPTTAARTDWTRAFESMAGKAALAGLCGVLFLVLLQPASDTDLFWHLGYGRYVLEHGEIPFDDPFGFAIPGERICMGYFGAQILQAAAYRAFGYPGLHALEASIILGALGILLVLGARAGASPPLLLGWTAYAVYQSSFRFLFRPQDFMFLLVPAWLFSLEGYLRSKRWWWLAPQPLLTALWANLHPSFFLGPILSGCAVAGLLYDHLRSKERIEQASPWPIAGFAAISSFTPAFNPCGLESLLSPFRWERIVVSTDMNENLPLSPEIIWHGHFTLALVLLCAVFLWPLPGTRRSGFHVLTAAFLAAITLQHHRFIALLFLVTIPMVGAYATTILRRSNGVVRGSLGLLLLALAFKECVPLAGHLGARFRDDKIPIRATDFLAGSGLSGGRIFHDYNWGGYLSWRLAPKWRTFVDGRGHIFGVSLLDLSDRMPHEQNAWREADARFHFDAVIFPTEHAERLFSFLEADGKWALVYWDDTAALALLRKPEWSSFIDRHEYRVAKPWIAMAQQDSSGHAALSAEAERNWDETQSAISAFMISNLAMEKGDATKALKVLADAAQTHPDNATLWNNLAVIERRAADLPAALAHFQRAIDVLPGYRRALAGKARTLEDLGDPKRARGAYEDLLAADPGSTLALEGLQRLKAKAAPPPSR